MSGQKGREFVITRRPPVNTSFEAASEDFKRVTAILLRVKERLRVKEERFLFQQPEGSIKTEEME